MYKIAFKGTWVQIILWSEEDFSNATKHPSIDLFRISDIS